MKDKDKVNSLLEKIKSNKRIAIIISIGLLGIFLLTLSEFLPKNDEEKIQPDTKNSEENFLSYEENLEKRLEKIISSIDGAGAAKVMVTVESGKEKVYAVEQKNNISESNNSFEKQYVVIRSDGDEEGLLLKVDEPEVRGVAVVCQGAGSAAVRQEIISTVTAVLSISTNRVNISKMSNGGNQ